MSQNKSPEGQVYSGFVFDINEANDTAHVFELKRRSFVEFDVACGGLNLIVGDPVVCRHWRDQDGKRHLDLLLERLPWHAFDPDNSRIAVS